MSVMPSIESQRPVSRALSILGLTQEKARGRPDERDVVRELMLARQFRARTKELLPMERPGIENELDHRLCALESGAQPFRRIPHEKLREVLSWRDTQTGLPVLAPFSIKSDKFTLVANEWGGTTVQPTLPGGMNTSYSDVFALLQKRRANRRVDVQCTALFRGLVPTHVRQTIMGAQKRFSDIRVLAEVDAWQIEEHERPSLSEDPLVIGWDGQDFWLLATFDLTPTEEAVRMICLGHHQDV